MTTGIIYATGPGGTTIDQDAQGGNPFATALIQLATGPRVGLRDLPARLRALTMKASGGHQRPQWSSWPARRDWSLVLPPGSRRERRVALVLIVSDYVASDVAPLGGAAYDERRVAAMLSTNGFSVTQGIGSTRAEILTALARFHRTSMRHDVAVVYSTGHGVDVEGAVSLLPGDYPFVDGYSRRALAAHAVSVARMAASCKAERINLVFFAGCRTTVPR